MNKAVKTTLALAAGAVAVAGTSLTPAMVSAWGDNAGGRASYTKSEIESGILGNSIVFNSISDGEFGSEKNFVGARVNDGTNLGASNVWAADNITVEEGKEYYIRAFVHNNNPNGEDAIAENVRVAFSIPNTSAKDIRVNGFITASNATPSKYWDYVDFHSDRAFHLEYVYGSAILENNGIGSGDGVQLPDAIVTKAASENGAQIGYSSLNGEIPGCYAYSGFVGIKVRVVFDESDDFTINTKVKVVGTKTGYEEVVEAKAGDRVQFQIEYTNTSSEDQKDVMIKSILPAHLRYVEGTTKLYNSNHEGGLIVDQNTITGNGINIGDYGPGANAYIRFTAEVIDENTLSCGSNTLVNWAQGWVKSTGLQDYASVVVNKVCENVQPTPNDKPTNLPSTGPEAIAGGAIAAGSIVTAAGYFIASRRSLR